MLLLSVQVKQCHLRMGESGASCSPPKALISSAKSVKEIPNRIGESLKPCFTPRVTQEKG